MREKILRYYHIWRLEYYVWQFKYFKQHQLSAILDVARHHITTLDYTSPLILTCVNYAYVELLDNWLCAMERIGIDIKKQCLLVALDKKTHCHIQEKGLNSVLCDLDIFTDSTKMSEISCFRARFYSLLVDMGIDFIHSDVDAIWLKNPLSYLARHDDYDLLASQGTVHPKSAFLQWKFVLCCGFFFLKSTKQTRFLFKEAANVRYTYAGDQAWLNRALVKYNLDWQINDTYTFGKNSILCSDVIIGGQS